MNQNNVKAWVETMDELYARCVKGEWQLVRTPFYLMQGQDKHEGMGLPVTIASPGHSEEIATFWTYLMDQEAHAGFVCRLVTSWPEIRAALLAWADTNALSP